MNSLPRTHNLYQNNGSKNSNVLQFATAGEDCFLRVWQIKDGPNPQVWISMTIILFGLNEFSIFLQIDFLWCDRVGDLQLQGLQFISPDGRALAATGYDNNEILFYKR